MDNNNEMELYSPVSSPIPTTQEDSPSLNRQKIQEEIQFLNIFLENTAATLSAYKNRRFFDENDFTFQAELSRYREAEARLQNMVSAYSANPPCEYNGCPYHSEHSQNERNIPTNNLSPKNTPQKRTTKLKATTPSHRQLATLHAHRADQKLRHKTRPDLIKTPPNP
ncbi:hypothetical protein NPIL_246771 [Nephila pilipes]|uniref:Uncharacterized protein n=1 Tax=Nephila pilipes TaxID=299642 RepID=A0A8X6T6Y7_NEPPI|nr:hypothetical protein NPIL_246771 [Nephila pilipes]